MKKVTLELTNEEALLLQTCCEFVEQFIESNGRHDQFVQDYTEGNANADGLYWYADKMSFDLARLREKEKK